MVAFPPPKFVKLEDFRFLIKVWKFNFYAYMFIIIALITNQFLRLKNKYWLGFEY